MKSISVRARLYLLILLCLLPVVALVIVSFVDMRNRDLADARAEALRVARLAAASQERSIEATRQLLTMLSELPEVMRCDGPSCQRILSGLLPRFGSYLNFGLIRTDGKLAASALPATEEIDLSDRRYFQEAARTREFTVGEYQVGRITKRPSLNFGYRVLDASGELQGVLYAALDLSWTDKLAAESDLGSNASLLMLDANGTIVTRYPESGRWTGVVVNSHPLARAILGRREGVYEGVGLDDVERIHGFTPLGPERGLFVSVGLSREETLAPSKRSLTYNLAALGLVLLLAAMAAWIGGEALILRRLRAVFTAAERFVAGDLAHRAPVEGADEVSRVASAFNEIAERLGGMIHAEQEAKDRLAHRVDELVRDRTREATLLNEMGQLLQAAADRQEACAIIGRVVPRLFPGRSGGVFLTNVSRNLVESTVHWGTAPAVLDFPPEDCWALRRGQPHCLHEVGDGTVCRHVGLLNPTAYCCIPLTAQSDTLGVFHIAGEGLTDQATHHMVMAVADQCALALANLRLRETLRSQSIRDSLTGIFNRRYLEETLEREVRRAARSGQGVGVVMFDVDHFKAFNDRFGHEAGDAVLREVGALLLRSTRGGDVAGRLGGEEFVVLMPDSKVDDARRRADQIRQDVERLRVSMRGEPLGPVTVSAGVAAYPDHGAQPADLLRSADAALYRAKEGGRNRVEVA